MIDTATRVGNGLLIYFSSMKLVSWHGPYRITSCSDLDVTAVKTFFPTDSPMQVHQSRVKECPK